MCPKLESLIRRDTLGDPQSVKLSDIKSLEEKGSTTTAVEAA